MLSERDNSLGGASSARVRKTPKNSTMMLQDVFLKDQVLTLELLASAFDDKRYGKKAQKSYNDLLS